MGYLSYSAQPDTTEKALLRAMKAAKAAYEQGAAERRPILREVYLHTLRAFNAYVAVAPSPCVDDAVSTFPVFNGSPTADQQYRALMAACGLA